MRNWLLFFVFLMAYPVAGTAATDSSASDSTTESKDASRARRTAVAKRLGDFFDALGKDDIKGAYALLTESTILEEKAEEIRRLVTSTEQAVALFGKISGYEIVDVKTVGTRLMEVTVLSVGEKFPLRWRFLYYRPSDPWQLIDIQVDDRLSTFFEAPKAEAEKEKK